MAFFINLIEKIKLMKFIFRLIFSFLLMIKISLKINNLLLSHGEDLIFLEDTKENYKKILSAIGNRKTLLEKYKFSKQSNRLKFPNFYIFLLKIFYKNFKKSFSLTLNDEIYLHKTIFEALIYEALFDFYFETTSSAKAICYSNDHSPMSVAFFFSAKRNGKYLIYFQHGLITSYFPPMIADYSFLYDQRSKDIYQEINDKYLKNNDISLKEINYEILKRESFTKTNYPEKPDIKYAIVLGILSSSKLLKKFLKIQNQFCIKKENTIIILHPLIPFFSFLRFKLLGKVAKSIQNVNAEIYICGNTSAMYDLLQNGKKVYFSRYLDKAPFDYYGLLKEGYIKEVSYKKLHE